MRSTKPLLRIAALSSFVLLMVVFVAYRGGALDRFLGENDNIPMNEIERDHSRVDSPPAKVSDPGMLIMPSSKSGGMFIDDLTPNQQDTAKKSQSSKSKTKPAPPDTSKKKAQQKKAYMGGSKSGYIFDPIEEPAPVQDTTKQEKQQQTKTPAPNKKEVYMGGSKSAPVFKPKPDTSNKKPE